MSSGLTNWAGNTAYQAVRVHRPESESEVQSIVRAAVRVKALGSRHSFNTIADTPEDLVSTEHLDSILNLDQESQTVTVQGGITYGKLCMALDQQGFAIANLASLPHISVVGACATATHGSGQQNGNLATSVSGIRFVTGEGEVVSLSKGESAFEGAVVGLGAFGIVTEITLDLVPAFSMKQEVFESLPFSTVESDFNEIVAAGYSVSLFTDWKTDNFNQLWVKSAAPPEGRSGTREELFGALATTERVTPVPGGDPNNCTEQSGVTGPWYDRLPHFRMGFTPSSGDELQTEYIVPRQFAIDALRTVNSMRDEIAPLLQISEIRMIAADDLWMSPCYRLPGVGIHFTWRPDWPGVREILPVIDERLAVFEAKPHWGKLFISHPERIQSLYPRLSDFRRLVAKYDPVGKFRNEFLDEYVL